MARRLGVSREDVIAAAVRVCDRDGSDGLTVAAVAAEVGCRPPSVYHHVEGLDGVLRAVTLVAAAHLVDELQDAIRDQEGVAAVRAVVSAARQWGLAHPGRFAALRTPVGPDADPELAAARAAVLLPVQDALAAAGVPRAQRPALVAALVAAVRGCISADLDAETRGTATPADARTVGHDLLVELLLGHIAQSADRPAVAP